MPPLLLALLLAAQPQPPPAPAPPPPPDPRRLLARLAASEPPILEVQAAAARQADRTVPDPSALAARRRTSALLPRLTAELRHDQRDYRVTGYQSSGAVDYLHSSPGSAVSVHVTWELGDLVVAPGEVAAAAASLARARRRDEAVRRATAVHFERRERQLALLLDPPTDARLLAGAELEVARLTAELDALTGGLFTGRGP
jgi:hypothetical protein